MEHAPPGCPPSARVPALSTRWSPQTSRSRRLGEDDHAAAFRTFRLGAQLSGSSPKTRGSAFPATQY
jgi:hypothetical protein